MMNKDQICFKRAKHVNGKNTLVQPQMHQISGFRNEMRSRGSSARPATHEGFTDMSAGTEGCSVTFSFAKSI